MRQTQFVMGVVLLVGAVATYFVSPVWLIVSAIVGLGLLAAGVTGVCPMALVVAKLPWNRPVDGSATVIAPCCDR
jgi:hypothetical protein